MYLCSVGASWEAVLIAMPYFRYAIGIRLHCPLAFIDADRAVYHKSHGTSSRWQYTVYGGHVCILYISGGPLHMYWGSRHNSIPEMAAKWWGVKIGSLGAFEMVCIAFCGNTRTPFQTT